MDLQGIKERWLKVNSELSHEDIAWLITKVGDLTQLCEEQGAVALQWTKGEPPYPYGDEWFIARTLHRYKVVLRSLPKEHSYDYTTADGTYMKRENVTAWMQFPDSKYKSYALTLHAEEKALMVAQIAGLEGELSQAREEVERLTRDGAIKHELYTQTDQRLRRLAADAIGALAGAVCTPAEGDLLAPHCLGANIQELRRCAADAIRQAAAQPAEVCCDWTAGDKRGCYVTKCGNYLHGQGYQFCPYCGKPMKVNGE